jgi:hypothetical protein
MAKASSIPAVMGSSVVHLPTNFLTLKRIQVAEAQLA